MKPTIIDLMKPSTSMNIEIMDETSLIGTFIQNCVAISFYLQNFNRIFSDFWSYKIQNLLQNVLFSIFRIENFVIKCQQNSLIYQLFHDLLSDLLTLSTSKVPKKFIHVPLVYSDGIGRGGSFKLLPTILF